MLKIKSLSVSTLIFLTKSNDWSKNNAMVVDLRSRVPAARALSGLSEVPVPLERKDEMLRAHLQHLLYTRPFSHPLAPIALQGVVVGTAQPKSERNRKAFNFDPPTSTSMSGSLEQPSPAAAVPTGKQRFGFTGPL